MAQSRTLRTRLATPNLCGIVGTPLLNLSISICMQGSQYIPGASGQTLRGTENVTEDAIVLVTKDQHSLAGTVFQNGGNSLPQMAAIINCGAGIAARHYRPFARYLAANNVAVLTYDYRGIGRSRRGTLRGFPASFEDWAEYDCSSAINYITNRFDVPIFGISHSIGALIFGGALNVSELTGLVMIAPHTGYVGDYRRAYRLPMALLWHAVMPTLTSIVGYFPSRRLRLGEDIPKGVAMAWARRRRPQPALSAGSRTRKLMDRIADIEMRALAITVSDDGFGTSAGAERVSNLFRRTSFDRTAITPQDASVAKLGHFGFFRAPPLWEAVIRYLRDTATNYDHGRQPKLVPL